MNEKELEISARNDLQRHLPGDITEEEVSMMMAILRDLYGK